MKSSKQIKTVFLLFYKVIMEKQIYRKRLSAVRNNLGQRPEMEYDAAWIIQPENRRYCSGFTAEDTQCNESSGSLLINGEHALLVTDSRYTLQAQEEAADFSVKTLKSGFMDDFPELIKETGTKILGFEGDCLSWKKHRELTEKLAALSPPVPLEPMDSVIEDMREIKEEIEIAALKAAALMISRILDELIPLLKPGMTEQEVAWEIKKLARAAGADGLSFPPIVASGPNGALPHAEPSNRKLRQGEPVIIDTGVKLDGYCSDITRTVFLGNPDKEFVDIYRTVRAAQLAALKSAKPHMQSVDLDFIARNFIKEAGYGDYFGHGLGHGVGLATHEGPRVGPRNPVTLKPGNVITIEPGIYIPGKGGVRLEEMVRITETGSEILTECDHFYDL